MMRGVRVLACPLLVVALSLSGCQLLVDRASSGDGGSGPSAREPVDTDAGPAKEVPGSARNAGNAGNAGSPLATAENTVASGVESARVEVTIDSLEQVSGTTITANFTLTASDPSEGDDSWDAYTVFTEKCGYDCINEFAVSGVYLLDETEQKRYLVYRDSSGTCVCTVFDSEVFPVGRPVSASASFPAPPPSTKQMTVVIPGFPPFKSIPIAR